MAERPAANPETAFASTTTGTCNMLAVLFCRDTAALLTYLTHRPGALSGIEPAPITAHANTFRADPDSPHRSSSARSVLAIHAGIAVLACARK
ncbi:hypothetical protein C5E45_02880 [Nocardia nova]|uniref:Uncharacterized protein n=1 Tax=Nocardia nova TaxID=37330 RepID=A0A2S6AXX3_9NOCA|nr:hypothetical protein [Nocardia nova]PPJ34147.1 hypothetical protein C5E41_00620 [Nocardia nova]PPJ40043.1 hypothetical protein C5E45_02880 [Nocardia nova]